MVAPAGTFVPLPEADADMLLVMVEVLTLVGF